jgi:hypothetical protein
MNRITLGVICRLGFGLLDAALMLWAAIPGSIRDWVF